MTQHDTYPSLTSVAIVGMAGRFPGARNIQEFWRNLRDGVESVSVFSDEELVAAGVAPSLVRNPNYVKARAVVQDIDLFDAAFFGFNPREAEITDPQHRLFLECAWEALEDAGYEPASYPGVIGVFAGANISTYLLANLLTNPELVEVMGYQAIMMGNLGEYMPTRLSYKLGLTGPSISIQTACSTSLVAIYQGCQSLLSYQSDMVLAGGAAVTSPNKSGYVYQAGGIVSPDGHCRTFDAEAQGFVGGDGVGIVVLKRLEDALEDGDAIYAVIRGAAANNDGALKAGFTAPGIEGQAGVIAMAQAVAEVDPATIGYIEAHGTGTQVGDPIEIAALTQVFRDATDRRGFCAIGSLKTNVGHMEAAAGVASLIKTALALKYRLLPPSLHFRRPNPRIDFANSPFYVNTALQAWEPKGVPLRAGVSSFGIGGTNTHVILEEAPARARTPSTRRRQLLLLSAKTAPALEAANRNLADYLRNNPDANLADVTYTLQVGRRAFSHRQFAVCSDADDARQALQSGSSGRIVSAAPVVRNPPVVFLFPGQGAQYVQMARGLYETEPTIHEHIDRCAAVLQAQLGLDIRMQFYPAADDEPRATECLGQTALTQPALFVVEYALAQLWMSWGVQPEAMLGHSIGEYVAATLAGVFSLETALTLVAERGRLMQALPAGAMLSVQMPEPEVSAILPPELALAAVNAPDLCVVAGTAQAVDEFERRVTSLGGTCRRLHTSHAFHSPMMTPILEPFRACMAQVQLKPPQIPFISNVTGTWISAEQATDPAYWATHLRQTVRFAEGVGELLQDANRIFLEVGPGHTLSGLVRQHADAGPATVVLPSLRHPRDSQPDDALLLNTLGRLWLAGVEIDWRALHQHEKRQRLSLPTYPFERQSYWIKPGRREAVGALTKRADLGTWFYLAAWVQQTPLARAVLHPDDGGAHWLIFDDECGLGSLLAARLRAAAQDVVTVQTGDQFARLGPERFAVDPANRDDYRTLLGSLRAEGRMPSAIMHLWGVTEPQVSVALEGLETSQRLGFYSVLYLAQALGEDASATPIQVMVITNGLQDVSGEEVLQPEKATVLGPCRVIGQEYAQLHGRSIDILWPSRNEGAAAMLVEALLAEATTPVTDTVVAYRGRYRWVQSLEPVQLPNTAPPANLREGGVYLITGGLGGIGLALAEYLAQRVRAHLVLTSRSALPPRESWRAWLAAHDVQDRVSRRIRQVMALEEMGASVLVLKADVTDLAEMRAVVQQTRARFSGLHGVVHAAGIAGAGVMQRKTPEQAAAVLDPKVRGTLVLDAALAGSALDFFVLCSSTTALHGILGQSDYTGANAFLDAFAHQRHAGGESRCVAINWDAWQEVGMAVDTDLPDYLKLQRMQQLADGISTQEGQEVFGRIIGTSLPQVVVSTRDVKRLLEQAATQHEPASAGGAEPPASPATAGMTAASVRMRPALATPYQPPSIEIEQQIAAVWCALLGIQQIGVHDSFFDLGGDSLLAVRLVSRLRETTGLTLAIQDVFDAPTIAGLVEILQTALAAAQALPSAQHAVAGEREEIEL